MFSFKSCCNFSFFKKSKHSAMTSKSNPHTVKAVANISKQTNIEEIVAQIGIAQSEVALACLKDPEIKRRLLVSEKSKNLLLHSASVNLERLQVIQDSNVFSGYKKELEHLEKLKTNLHILNDACCCC